MNISLANQFGRTDFFDTRG